MAKGGCSIYSNRPHNPCKGFKCVWKENRTVPKEFKPNTIDMIMTNGYLDGIHYVHIVPAGQEITVDVLDWAITAVNGGEIKHIVYQKNNKAKIISQDPDFITKYKEHLATSKTA
jgi:hypothetical protein